jgi:hypothetical protein
LYVDGLLLVSSGVTGVVLGVIIVVSSMAFGVTDASSLHG